jgi:hypothetical protein
MTNNFIKLIEKYTIIIPLIQRDYAQGRETEKAKANKFLNAIHDGIENGLNLDFIYGETKENKFIPLDGQQRLTTLFLLHWYASIGDDYLPNLTKFSYEVRSSTKDFIKGLTEKENWKKFGKTEIKKSIENSNWFFLSWKNDPTVLAILNMLDLIENIFKDTKVVEFNKITFELLKLNDFKLTDELYVKMNARGKPLTEFENFKAEFEKYINNYETKAKLDNQWLDIFWKIADYNPKKADEMFYNFFYNVTFNFYLENKDKLECKINNENILFLTVYDKKNQTGFVNKCSIFDFYKDVYKEKKYIEKVVLILDNLQNDTSEEFKIFIEKKEISQWERARFYAFSQYLLKSKQVDLESEEYKIWFRVTNNIINNFNIDSIDKFKNILNLINEMSEFIDNLLEYVSSDEFINEKPGSFKTLEYQKYEEHLKAKLLQKDTHWNEAIEKAEKHWYLNGHIGFLIKLADNNLEVFKEYYKRFNAIFKEDKKDFLFQRALLTKGSYLVKQKGNYSFCSFGKSPRVKDDNWKEVFHNKREILKELLVDDRDLTTIISESKVNDWRKGFIEFPEILKYCKKYQIRFKNEHNILLLTKERVYGKHAEYFTYWLYCELLNLHKEVECKYFDNKSTDEEKYILINGCHVTYKDTSWHINDEKLKSKEELLERIKNKQCLYLNPNIKNLCV